MLVDAIAIVILTGMMFVPLVNVLVGAIVRSGVGGIPGCIAGIVLAIAITLAEKVIGDRRGWFRASGQGNACITASDNHQLLLVRQQPGLHQQAPVRELAAAVSGNAR